VDSVQVNLSYDTAAGVTPLTLLLIGGPARPLVAPATACPGRRGRRCTRPWRPPGENPDAAALGERADDVERAGV